MARMMTTNFTNLIKPGLRKVYFSTITDIPKEFRQWANVITGGRPGGEAGSNYFDDLQVASLGSFLAKPEGQPIQYDRIQEIGTVRYQPYTYGLGFRITMEMMADELYGVMSKMSRELAASAMHQMEFQAHRPLNSGFGTTGGTGLVAPGFDTLALFSTAHTLKRGGTAANRASTDQDLSVTAVETARDLFELTVNESGMPTPRRMETLIVGPKLYWVAKEITESELKPYTGNNEINPLGGEGFRFMVSHYLTDEDSWFALGPKSQHDINVWIRESPTFDMGDDFDTGDSKGRGFFRMAIGHGDWRGTFGSQGA